MSVHDDDVLPAAAEVDPSSLPAVEAGAAAGQVSGFPPIGDYAFLSDCETCALIASGGSVEWLCLPRPDSASVFGSMLERSAGVFGLVPEGTEVPSHRRYLPGSMVLETTRQTPTGWLQVYDCLVTHRIPSRSTPATTTPSSFRRSLGS
jgi:GH15 family glucan-1,4-alpha-glucosidase